MSIEKAVSEFEMEVFNDKQNEIFIHSRYEFLRGHNGIRPDSLHGLMAPTHAGKSTLAKCIIAETAAHFKVMVWLSEETIEEYQQLIHQMDKSVLENIFFVQERNIPEEIKEDQSQLFEYFDQMVEDVDPFCIFIDNLTTSCFYNSKFGFYGQTRTAEFMRDYPKTKKKSVFYVAHTDKTVTENHNKVTTSENMRGSKELGMNTEYLYIIQKFTANGKIYNLIRVAKYRHHKKAAGWYALKFEQDVYVSDARVDFSVVNAIFKSRDFLGRSDKKKKESKESSN